MYLTLENENKKSAPTTTRTTPNDQIQNVKLASQRSIQFKDKAKLTNIANNNNDNDNDNDDQIRSALDDTHTHTKNHTMDDKNEIMKREKWEACSLLLCLYSTIIIWRGFNS